MPVRSLTQSVLRWPTPEQVLQAARSWALEQRRTRPGLRRVGVFGSYGRGTASVGSDLDLLRIDDDAVGPQHQRLRHWPLELLPLSCDALVLTSAEFEQFIPAENRMARELKSDLRWVL
jgi:hypothetical protein